jgi:mannose-6-phosphate isomerase
MYQLENDSMPYAWGSTTAIAELQGRAASGKPEAELWMGAHPGAPSKLPEEGGRSLADLIAEKPLETLGARVSQRYENRLPFLFKVLAAGEPLSLQAHPSKQQAEEGFAREEALGIPRNAPHRNYKDDNHKPELICALTEFRALCGFRPLAEFAELVSELEVRELTSFVRKHDGNLLGLEGTFTALFRAPKDGQVRLVDSTLAALAHQWENSSFAHSHACARDLADKYPGDIGVVLSLMLNHVTLQPGQALYLPAGNLHAYLHGTGLELMANSDNVLRGGLTPKHVDVPELTKVLAFEPWSGTKRLPEAVGPGQWRYPTGAGEFELWRIDVTGLASLTASGGPEILILTEGSVVAGGGSQAMRPGHGVFVSAREGDYELVGTGTVYRAIVP